ncbi:MAG: lysylphosphatidylglycerol synthase domain-containing protein, partial [Nannocystaceae bacterium]
MTAPDSDAAADAGSGSEVGLSEGNQAGPAADPGSETGLREGNQAATSDSDSGADGSTEVGASGGKPTWLNWRIIPSLLVTFAVVYLLVRYLAGADELSAALDTADWRFLPLAFVWLGCNLLLSAVRWRLILRAMGYRVAMGRALNAILSAWPVAVLTPSRA